jgi:hypothetical protein
MLERAAGFFQSGISPGVPPGDVKRLYAQIGELTWRMIF